MADVVGTAIVKILPDSTGFSAALSSQMAGATAAISGMGGASAAANTQLGQMGTTLTAAGASATAAGKSLTKFVTLPILGLGAVAVKVSADFQTSMLQVQAVSGATGDQFEALSEQAKELGRTTQFSASQAADGMGFLAMAGFEVQEILDAMPGVLNLAAAGNLDLAQAADIASNVLSGYALQASEIGRVNDVMAQTFTSTNTSLAQLGEAFKFVAPVAQSAGLELEEVNAALGLLGNAGIQGSMAGTTLRGAIAKLNKPSEEAAGALDRLGISVFDSEGQMRPFVDLVEQFETAGLNTADAMTIFGLRAGPGFQALVSQGSAALEDLTAANRRAGGEIEAINEELGLTETQLADLTAAFDATQSSVQDAGFNLDETSAALGGLINEEFTATEATDALNGAITAMGQEGFADMIGATRDAQGNLVNAEGEVISFIEAISILQSKGLTTSEALASLGAEGADLAEIASLDIDVMTDLFGATSEAGRGAEIAEIQMSGIRGSMLRLKSAAEGVAIAFGESGLLDAVANIAEAFAGLFQKLAGLNPAVFRFITIFGLLAASVGPVLRLFGSLSTRLGAYATAQAAAAAGTATTTGVMGTMTAFTTALNAALRATAQRLWTIVTNPVVLVLLAIAAAFKLMWDNSEDLPEAVKRLVDLFSGGFTAALAAVGDALAVVATWIGDKLASAGKAAGDALAVLVNLLADKLEPVLQSINDFLSDLFDNLKLVADVFIEADDFAQGFGETMDNVLGNTGALVGAFRTLGHTLLAAKDAFTDAGGKIQDAFGGVIKMFQGLFTLDWDKFKTGAQEAFEGVAGAAGDLFLRLPFIISQGVRDIGNTLFENLTNLPVVGPLAAKVQEIFNGVITAGQQAIVGVAMLFQGEFDTAMEWLGMAGQTISDTFTQNLPGLFSELGSVLATGFTAAFTFAIETLSPVWDALFEQARTFFTTTLPEAVAGVGPALSGALTAAGPEVGAAFSSLGAFITGPLASAIGSALSGIGAFIAGPMADALSSAVTSAGAFISGPLADAFVAAIQSSGDLGTRLLESLAEKVANVPVVQPLVDAFINVIQSSWDAAAESLDLLGSLFDGDFTAVKESGGEIGTTISDSIGEQLFTNLPTALGDLGGVIGDAFDAALDMLPTDTDLPILGNLFDLFGSVGEAAETTFSTLGDVIEDLSPIFDTISAEVGPTLDTIGRVVTEDLLPAFGELADPIRDIGNIIKGIGAVVLTVLGGAATVAIDGFRLAIEATTKVFSALDEVITPLAEFVSDVLGVAFELFRDVLGEIGDVIRGAVDVFAGLWDVLKGIVTLDFNKAFEGLKQALGGVLEGLRTLFWDLPGIIIEALLGLAGSIGGLMSDLAEALWNGLVEGIKGLGSLAKSAGEAIINLFVEGIPLALGAIADVGGIILGAIVDGITAVPELLGALLGVVVGAIGGVVDWFLTTGLPWIVGTFGSLVTAIPGALLGLLEGLLAAFFVIFEAVLVGIGTGIRLIIDFFIGLPGQIVEAITTFGPIVWEGFLTAITFIQDLFLGAVSFLWEFFRDLPGTIVDLMVEFGPVVWEGIRAGFEFIRNGATGIFDSIVTFVTEIPGRLIAALINIGTFVWEAVSFGFNFIRDQAVSVFQGIVNFVTGLPETIGNAIASIGTRAWELAQTAFTTLATNITNIFQGIVDFITGPDGVVSKIVDGIKSIPDLIGGAIDGIKGIFSGPFRWIAENVWNPFANALNAGLTAVGITGDPVPKINVSEAHAGGIIGSTVRGSTSLAEAGGPGERLVNMQDGEGVIPRSVMAEIGDDFSMLQGGALDAFANARVSEQDSNSESILAGGLLNVNDEIGGGILGLGVGPDIGPDIPGSLGDLARSGAAFILEQAIAPLRGILNGIVGVFPDNIMSDFIKNGVNMLFDKSIEFVKGDGEAQNISPTWLDQVVGAISPGGANLVGFTFGGSDPAGDLTPFINDMAAHAGQANSFPWILKYLLATGVPFRVTSTLRNSIVNGTNTPSLHNSGRAVDLAGLTPSRDSPDLLAIYNALGPGMSAIRNRIYSGPGGGGYGAVGSITYQDHHDHVHTALRRGGLVNSETFARLGEAGDELVLPLSDPRRTLELAMQNGLLPVLQEGARQNGVGTTFGQGDQGGTVGGTSTVVNQDITVVGVSFDQAMSEINARQEASVRRIRR